MSDTTTEPLWGVKELAEYLGYRVSTVRRMSSAHPDRLPPRVATLPLRRWVPEVVRQWAREHSRGAAAVRVGRPRKG